MRRDAPDHRVLNWARSVLGDITAGGGENGGGNNRAGNANAQTLHNSLPPGIGMLGLGTARPAQSQVARQIEKLRGLTRESSGYCPGCTSGADHKAVIERHR
jgi:hypothetical protein